MSIKDIIGKIGNRSKMRKEMIKDLDEQTRVEELVKNMRKSANQRELEGYVKERNEDFIKIELERMRKARDQDIKFGHNPLDVKNITSKTSWEVLKEKNLFAKNKNVISDSGSILKSNNNLMNNSKWLIK